MGPRESHRTRRKHHRSASRGAQRESLVSGVNKRADRWNKILVEASQQSRRVRLPILQGVAQPARAFHGYLMRPRKSCFRAADALPLNQVLPAASRRTQAILAIGPEGGWTEAEISAAQAGGFREAPRKLILRTETAVIAALSSINYALSE